jgi:hypothetical protein
MNSTSSVHFGIIAILNLFYEIFLIHTVTKGSWTAINHSNEIFLIHTVHILLLFFKYCDLYVKLVSFRDNTCIYPNITFQIKTEILIRNKLKTPETHS